MSNVITRAALLGSPSSLQPTWQRLQPPVTSTLKEWRLFVTSPKVLRDHSDKASWTDVNQDQDCRHTGCSPELADMFSVVLFCVLHHCEFVYRSTQSK
uniref:Uncharacterized protein n=1 Tax=Anguilla anguilla TaxID=7936 RepID=A0A0E9SXN1_ANGAN